jgi:hypothetical protein
MEILKPFSDTKKISDETAMVPFSEKGIDHLTRSSIIKRIINLAPKKFSRDSSGRNVEEHNAYLLQVNTFADLVEGMRDRKIKLDNPMSVIGKEDGEKIKKASDIVSQQLAIYVLTKPEDQSKFRRRWSRNVAELMDYLGRNRAKGILRLAIDQLSEPVQELFFSASSTNLMEKLGHVDMNVCNEARYGQYLRDAAYIPEESGPAEVMGELISVLEERICEGTINPDGVIEYVFGLEYPTLIINKLIESAEKNDQIDLLRTIFSSHSHTRHFAAKLSRTDPDKGTGFFTEKI